MTIKNWNVKMVVTKRDGSEHHVKAKFSSKLKRAISHKILRKTSNKRILEKDNKSSVILVSIRKSEKKESSEGETDVSLTKMEDKYHEIFLPPLDLVIEEAKHELLLEKLREEKMKNIEDDKYSDNFSQSTGDEEDIYEEMDVLQSYFENIHSTDYLEMGLITY